VKSELLKEPAVNEDLPEDCNPEEDDEDANTVATTAVEALSVAGS